MRIYLVTDEGLLLGKDLYRTVEAAVKGGVSMVQLREKESSTREFIERAIRLKEVLTPYGVPLIINDRVDVALAANADGVHVGQSDMPYEMVKRLLPDGYEIALFLRNTGFDASRRTHGVSCRLHQESRTHLVHSAARMLETPVSPASAPSLRN